MNFGKFNGYVNGHRIYHKGGGDPSGEMRRMEADRQRKVTKSMREIDHTFSGGAPAKRGVNQVTGMPQAGVTYYDENGNPVVGQPRNGKGFFGKMGAEGLPAEIYTGTEDVPATKGFNDDYYKSIADQFMAYQKPMFEEQVATARRELPMQFGSSGSSDFLRKQAELERDITRQEADLRDQSLDFANQRRAEVERDRGDLVSLANAGTDASAVAQLSAGRTAALSRPPVFSPIADLFQKYTAGYANSQIANNNNPMFRRDAPLLFNGGGGRSSAVRTVA